MDDVDAKFWLSIAGAHHWSKLPSIQDTVYYFNQGHMEDSMNAAETSDLYGSRKFLQLSEPSLPFLCTVLQVNFLAHHITDEMCIRLVLQPHGEVDFSKETQDPAHSTSYSSSIRQPNVGFTAQSSTLEKISEEIILYELVFRGDMDMAKISQECVDNLFPKLARGNKEQVIGFMDIHGSVWRFLHLEDNGENFLMVGWAQFIERKKPVEGDHIVLFKHPQEITLYIGIRRTRGEQSVKSALEAYDRAKNKDVFEILYYPKKKDSCFDFFVLKSEIVEASLKLPWEKMFELGQKVRFLGEPSHLGREGGHLFSFKPTDAYASSLIAYVINIWPVSPWKTLQVKVNGLTRFVSPWQLQPEES